MGFIQDFEHEIKLLFLLVILVLVVGLFGSLDTVRFEKNSIIGTQQQEDEQKYMVSDEEEEPYQQTMWYTNENLRVSFAYPEDWLVYDEAAWSKDNAAASCAGGATIENTVIVSRQDLGRCVGVQNFSAWPGDILMSFSERPWEGFPYILGQKTAQHTNIQGVSAVRYPYSEVSSPQRKQAVRLYANVGERGYIIEFVQADRNGNYDPVFDDILGSVQWLE